MKRLLCLFLLFSIAITCFPSTHAEAGIKINIYGDDAYAPYCFVKNGTYDGIYVQILEKAFARMPDYEINIIPVPYKRLLLGLERGSFFAAFPPYNLPQKRPWIDVYSVPILEEDFSVFCTPKVLKEKRTNWPEDFKNLRIGINDGFQIPDLSELNKVEDAASNTKNIKKLLGGRIDCYVNDSKSILYTAKNMGIEKSKLVKLLKISTEYGHLAFSSKNNPPFKNKFITKFNQIILEMKCSGEIESIVNTFIK
ncbi:substrate-binding periplasmic protein [Maridesulfovibrio sp.]|uniref:substrate-binding periplasmic protein n=1 Tax=unclassified Maridesulfovibrio TaxID=2794999 RepID=UPI003B003E93